MYYNKIKQVVVPLLGEQLLQMLMGSVDHYFLAYLGLSYLSGVSVANHVITIYQSIFLAFSSAIVSHISSKQAKASKNSVLSEVMSLTIVIGLVFGVFSVIGAKPLMLVTGVDQTVASIGSRYLQLVGGSIVFLGLMTSLGTYLRVQGDYNYPVKVSLIANGLNILLSGLSIYVWQFGLVGVAVSTVVSRLIAVCFLLKRLGMDGINYSLGIKWSPNLVRLALPATFERLTMRVGDLIMVMLLATFGTKALAGNAIGETIMQFNYMFGFSVSTAIVILTAQVKTDLGHRKKLLQESYALMLLCMFVVGLFIVVTRSIWIGLFTKDVEVHDISSLLMLMSLFGIPMTAGTLTLTAYSQGLGDTKTPFFATSIGMWLVRLGLGFVLAIGFQLGIFALYLSTLLDNLFRSLFMCVLLSRTSKES